MLKFLKINWNCQAAISL